MRFRSEPERPFILTPPSGGAEKATGNVHSGEVGDRHHIPELSVVARLSRTKRRHSWVPSDQRVHWPLLLLPDATIASPATRGIESKSAADPPVSLAYRAS